MWLEVCVETVFEYKSKFSAIKIASLLRGRGDKDDDCN